MVRYWISKLALIHRWGLLLRQQPNEYGMKRWKYRHRSSIAAFNTRKEVMDRGKEIPRKMLGEVVILSMNHNTATAKIMSTWREIYPGDQIQLLD